MLLFDADGQVLRALIRRSKELDESRWIVDPVPSQQEIADMIGKARETVSRSLERIRASGFVTVEGKTLVLWKQKLRRYWQS